MKYLVLCLTLCACGPDRLLESGKYDITITYEHDWAYPDGYVETNVVSIDDNYYLHNDGAGGLDAKGQDLDGVAIFTQYTDYGDDGADMFKAHLHHTDTGFEGKVSVISEGRVSYFLTVEHVVGVKQ
jgi:hypothetical protein